MSAPHARCTEAVTPVLCTSLGEPAKQGLHCLLHQTPGSRLPLSPSIPGRLRSLLQWDRSFRGQGEYGSALLCAVHVGILKPSKFPLPHSPRHPPAPGCGIGWDVCFLPSPATGNLAGLGQAARPLCPRVPHTTASRLRPFDSLLYLEWQEPECHADMLCSSRQCRPLG